jgi:demethylspheroidene O-methyltransferase
MAREGRMRDRLLAIRDRMLTSARFQELAAANPVTRRVANAQAQKAFDLCAGFVYSQILAACTKLGILDAVRAGPVEIGALATGAGLSVERTRILVDAAIAIGLLSRRSRDRIGLGMQGAAIVGNPGISAMIRHHALLYEDLSDPVALLRADRPRGQIRNFWTYAGGRAEETRKSADVAEYSTLMAESQHLVSGDIIAAVPFSRFRRMLDVGGGDGTFAASLVRSVGALKAVAFDLPSVAERARANFARLGVEERCEAVGGNFFTEALPRGCDALTLVRVLHDHDDDDALHILRSAREALASSGAIIVAEPMAGVSGATLAADAYFAFYLLAMGRGRPRSPDEIGRLLSASGFVEFRRVATRRPMLVSIVMAQSAKK